MDKTQYQPLFNLCLYGQGRSHNKLPRNYILSAEESLIIGCWEENHRIRPDFSLPEVVVLIWVLKSCQGSSKGVELNSLSWFKKTLKFHKVLPELGSSKQWRRRGLSPLAYSLMPFCGDWRLYNGELIRLCQLTWNSLPSKWCQHGLLGEAGARSCLHQVAEKRIGEGTIKDYANHWLICRLETGDFCKSSLCMPINLKPFQASYGADDLHRSNKNSSK